MSHIYIYKCNLSFLFVVSVWVIICYNHSLGPGFDAPRPWPRLVVTTESLRTALNSSLASEATHNYAKNRHESTTFLELRGPLRCSVEVRIHADMVRLQLKAVEVTEVTSRYHLRPWSASRAARPSPGAWPCGPPWRPRSGAACDPAPWRLPALCCWRRLWLSPARAMRR